MSSKDKKTTRELAKELGVSQGTIIYRRNEHKMSDEEIISHYKNDNNEKSKDTISLREQKLLAEIEFKKSATNRNNLKTLEDLGKLIDIEIVNKFLIEISTIIKLSQSQILQSLPATLTGKEIEDVSIILKNTFNDQLNYIGSEMQKKLKRINDKDNG